MSKNVGIFSFGYWGFGGDVQGLKQRFLRFNENTRGRGLLWIDLRISRSVRSVGFTGDAPRDAFGNRNYLWIKAFGNQRVRKRKDGVEIADYEAGFAELLKAIEQARRRRLDLILFCGCPRVSCCHRNNVMRWLKRRVAAEHIAGVEVLGEFPTMRYEHYYDSPSLEKPFNDWRKDHPYGFFLNCTPNWRWLLHSSKCHHFGGTSRRIGEDGWSVTRIPKLCSVDRRRLKRWAKQWGARTVGCSTCVGA